MTAPQEVVPSPWDTDAEHDALASALEPLPEWYDGMLHSSRPETTAFSRRRTPTRTRNKPTHLSLPHDDDFLLFGGGSLSFPIGEGACLMSSARDSSNGRTRARDIYNSSIMFNSDGPATYGPPRRSETTELKPYPSSKGARSTTLTHVIRLHRTGSVEVEQVRRAHSGETRGESDSTHEGQRDRRPSVTESIEASRHEPSTDSTVEGPTAVTKAEKNTTEDRAATRPAVNGSSKTTKSTNEVRATPVRCGTPQTQQYYAEQEQFWKERDGSLSSLLSDAELPSDGVSYAEHVAGDTDDQKTRVSIIAGEDVQARRTSGAGKTHHDAPDIRQPTHEERYQQRLDGDVSVPIGDQEGLPALEARRRQEVRRRRRRRLCSLREAEKLLSGVVETVEGDGTMDASPAHLASSQEARVAVLRAHGARLLSTDHHPTRRRSHGYHSDFHPFNGKGTPSTSSGSSPIQTRRAGGAPHTQGTSISSKGSGEARADHQPPIQRHEEFFGRDIDVNSGREVPDAASVADRVRGSAASIRESVGDQIVRKDRRDRQTKGSQVRAVKRESSWECGDGRREDGMDRKREIEDEEEEEEERLAENRVAGLSERIALRCLRVEEECIRRERAQTRLFQEQLRGVRQAAQVMARKAVGTERSRARRQLDQARSEFEEKSKALADENKAAERLWNQERKILSLQASSAKSELGKHKRLSREAADIQKREAEEALVKQKQQLTRGWAEERSGLRRSTEDAQRRATEGKARAEEEAAREARATRDSLEAQARSWKAKAEAAEKRASEERDRRRGLEAGTKSVLAEELDKARKDQERFLTELRTKSEADREAHALEVEILKGEHRNHILKVHQEKKMLADSARQAWQREVEELRAELIAKADEAASRATAEKNDALRRLRLAHDAEMRKAGRDILRLEREIRRLQENRNPSGVIARSRSVNAVGSALPSPSPEASDSSKHSASEAGDDRGPARAGDSSYCLEGVDPEEGCGYSGREQNQRQEQEQMERHP